ncbi:hypothetical protein [Bradyrhizobium japonicum]|uniref:hypothetical protein n=1 Tax=Bradyrhizobium japonicum TaxID=375 RepID=UPI00040D5DC4|nr:hypothetical protein [Bradyrhizobium japonicum]
MSNDRFIPTDGRPLTPYEREILTILQEECAEVIVAASKLLRFGAGNTNPSTGESNVRELSLELGDLQKMLSIVGGTDLADASQIEAGYLRKGRRLSRFLQTEPEGTAHG